MTLDTHIKSLITLGEKMSNFNDPILSGIIEQAYVHNNWFEQAEVKHCLSAWSKQLSAKNLIEWTSRYNFVKTENVNSIGLILAGNIPLVGLHDLISVIITNNKALVKLSSKDSILMKYVIETLYQIDEDYKHRIEIIERIQNPDAIIATGSNNSSRYFETYFGKYPNIIRKNRNSIALLDGKETKVQLEGLASDVFRYYGLGCRNITKVYVPKNYNLETIFKAFESFEHVMGNNKYKNNYDYNCTLLLMNKVPFLTNNFIMLKEDETLHAPTATVHIERYSDNKDLQKKVNALDTKKIQCISSDNIDIKDAINLGQCQQPNLWDYADNIDTIDFLLAL